MGDPSHDATLPAMDADGAEPRPEALAIKLSRAAVMDGLFGSDDALATTGAARYRPTRQLGAGASGVVFAARDTQLDRTVALKIIAAPHGAALSQQAVQRFLREARVIASLSHPNVVEIFDVGVIDDAPFLAMELVEGGSVDQWLQRARPTNDQIVEAFIQAARGLSAAHERHVVHRDFKPANALMGRDGRVRVADFGLAALNHPCPTQPPVSGVDSTPTISGSVDLTATGAVLGTPAFMAPEQHQGVAVDAAADQFAWCASLFAALYRTRPFDADTMGALYLAKLQGDVAEVSVPPTFRRQHAALLRGLAADPEARWPSMASLATQFEPSRPQIARWFVGGGVTLGVALGTMALGGIDQDPCSAAADAIAADWDQTRAAQLRDHLRSIDAMDLAGRAQARLDDFAARWATERRAACAERDSAGVAFDARVRCLRLARVDFRARIELLLEQPQRGAASDVGSLLANLPALSGCTAAERNVAERPRPDDPALAKRVDELRRRRTAMAPRLDVRVTDADDAELSALIADAEAIAYGPVVGELRAVRGRLLEAAGDLAAAAAEFERAHALASADDDVRGTFDAAVKLMRLYAESLDAPEKSARWGKFAEAALLRMDRPSSLLARYEDTLGIVALTGGDAQAALGHFETALEQLEPNAAEQPGFHAAMLNGRGRALDALGRTDEAVATLQRAATVSEATFGADHALTIAVRYNLGDTLGRSGQPRQAMVALQACLAAVLRTTPGAHAKVAVIDNELGNLARASGDLVGARAHFAAGLDAAELVTGATGDALTVALGGALGETLSVLDEHTAALERLRTTLQRARSSLEPDNPNIITTQLRLGKALRAAGDDDDAAAELRRVVDKGEAIGALDLVARARFMLAELLVDTEPDHAIALAERARQRWAEDAPPSATRPYPGSADNVVAEIDAWLAEHEPR